MHAIIFADHFALLLRINTHERSTFKYSFQHSSVNLTHWQCMFLVQWTGENIQYYINDIFSVKSCRGEFKQTYIKTTQALFLKSWIKWITFLCFSKIQIINNINKKIKCQHDFSLALPHSTVSIIAITVFWCFKKSLKLLGYKTCGQTIATGGRILDFYLSLLASFAWCLFRIFLFCLF